MKAIFIVYSPAIECFIMTALKNCGQKKYTKFPYLHGVGISSEPHLDTNIWPGINSALLVITDEKTKNKIMVEIKEIKNKYREQGVKAFVWEIEEEI